MSYYESMQELIGNTPIVKLNNVGVPSDVNLFAKLELYNPSGSVKDRTGKYMIEDAENKGLLKDGGIIIEGTAGNTGLGIAFAAAKKLIESGIKGNIVIILPDRGDRYFSKKLFV